MKAFLEADAGFIRDIFWSDGMVRATGREYNGLIESPCFKNATDDGAHDVVLLVPHDAPDAGRSRGRSREWADDQLAPRALGNGACLQCHRSASRRRPTLDARTHAPSRRFQPAAPATTATCRTRPTAC